jgi:hypothetical protein
MTAEQHSRLRRHLFPPDGCESVALALCGTRLNESRQVYCIHEILEIPDHSCISRTPTAVRWQVELGLELFARATKRSMTVLKIHSHQTGFEAFSKRDDESDANLLGAICQWTDKPMRHISAFMLPEGTITARLVGRNHADWSQVDRVMVVGDEITTFHKTQSAVVFDGADLRTRQAFGDGTTRTLKSMCVGVAGCSGTGSWVVEMLARLGVGRLVLIDPDRVERKNLNRIVNSTGQSAQQNEYKVDVLARAIKAMDLGTVVEPHGLDLAHKTIVEYLAECDAIFGCLDSADGRDLLNRIATFYTIPFIDVGVHLEADGAGGISQICCAVHYLIPGGSSLLSRGAITPEQISAQALRRRNPSEYQARLKEGYIHGVAVDSPAVISVNGFAASHAVNELLARIHRFRFDDNSEFRHQTLSLRDGSWLRVPDGSDCDVLRKRLGRGDCIPLIDNPTIQ